METFPHVRRANLRHDTMKQGLCQFFATVLNPLIRNRSRIGAVRDAT